MAHLKHAASGHLLHGPNGHLVHDCGVPPCACCAGATPRYFTVKNIADIVSCPANDCDGNADALNGQTLLLTQDAGDPCLWLGTWDAVGVVEGDIRLWCDGDPATWKISFYKLDYPFNEEAFQASGFALDCQTGISGLPNSMTDPEACGDPTPLGFHGQCGYGGTLDIESGDTR